MSVLSSGSSPFLPGKKVKKFDTTPTRRGLSMRSDASPSGPIEVESESALKEARRKKRDALRIDHSLSPYHHQSPTSPHNRLGGLFHERVDGTSQSPQAMTSPLSMSSLDRPSTHNSPRKRLAESFSGSPRSAMLSARPSTTSSSPSRPTGTARTTSKVVFEQPGSAPLLRARTLLRVEPPMALRMPERDRKSDHADIFSVDRTAQLYDVDGEVVTLKSPGRRSRGVSSGMGSSVGSSSPSLMHSSVRDLVRGHRSIRDFEFLAQACQRAGKTRLESQAYYKLSVLYENEGRTRSAASALRSFLNVSRRLHDYDSEVLALNSLGILLYHMGGDRLVEAVECHSQHFEIGEPIGKFIAEINLGMCYAAQEQWSNSLDHFKDALQFAIRLGNVEGESISLANVAWAAENVGDYETARTCFERHIELAESLGDRNSIPDAYHELGKIANEMGDYKSAVHFFEAARDHAKKENAEQKEKDAAVQIGVSAAAMQMDTHMERLAESMSPRRAHPHSSRHLS
eukprot:TRINITY_DN19599_c0_g1_i1.p1 TRINITY_DN19599_c0_g1~~TRINITY_DN19599_c0_g1_i1.p1  ORF type:complete len:515 (+),score=112.32 TRINITY_DN19599_c0_g1_i1:162-1706(+)